MLPAIPEKTSKCRRSAAIGAALETVDERRDMGCTGEEVPQVTPEGKWVDRGEEGCQEVLLVSEDCRMLGDRTQVEAAPSGEVPGGVYHQEAQDREVHLSLYISLYL